MTALLLLGVALSVDSFRVSIGLGAMRPPALRQARIAVAFGLADGLAPLLGILLGQAAPQGAGRWTDLVGPLILALYGAYVICMAHRCGGELAEPGGWMVYGLPVTLSVDNLVAGASLGLHGDSMFLSAAVIGGVSAAASLAGLAVGRMAVHVLPAKAELAAGVALVGTAVAMAFGPA
ncbi:MAG: manganese efflux pump [Bryobacterales bacterium]|nr:manganese efflux pump [Bryobacterales bacterium]